jgi:hypothetical protein
MIGGRAMVRAEVGLPVRFVGGGEVLSVRTAHLRVPVEHMVGVLADREKMKQDMARNSHSSICNDTMQRWTKRESPKPCQSLLSKTIGLHLALDAHD